MLPAVSVSPATRLWAIVEAVAATLIWSSSFVLVKLTLDSVGPLTVTGLRYALGGLLLLALMPLRRGTVLPITKLPRRLWLHLGFMGLTVYGLGNGAFNLSLNFMPATTVSFLAAFTPMFIMIAAIFYLQEIPTRGQGVGLVTVLGGSTLFFGTGSGTLSWLGLGLALVGLASFTHFGIVGRTIARNRQTDTMTLTALPLVLGGFPVLVLALAVEGIPRPDNTALIVIPVLAVFNTAVAYLMYNHALKQLTALEVNVIFNLSPLGTAVIAWFLLGEWLLFSQIIGMVIVVIGVTVVQWQRRRA